MRMKREFIMRQIAGDNILVPVGKDAVDLNGLIILNELGAFLWEHIPMAENETQLTQFVLDEYEVTEERASRDVHNFIERLASIDVIEP